MVATDTDSDLLLVMLRQGYGYRAASELKPTQPRFLLQRDVPGFTRAAIPILHSQGVRAVSVGVNGGSAPPGVPKNTPFWWRDEASGKQLLAFWHPGIRWRALC